MILSQSEAERQARIFVVQDAESAALLARLRRRVVRVGDRAAFDAIGPGEEVLLVGFADSQALRRYFAKQHVDLWAVTVPPGTENTVAAFVADRAASVPDPGDEERAAFVVTLEEMSSPCDLEAVLRGAELLREEGLPKARPCGIEAVDVVQSWRAEGPLVHLPTGIDKLDEMTGGGPTVGSRVFLNGAPDAGKTALSVQVADRWASDGIAVGFLAVDEEPSDLLQRFLQRRGIARRQTELRDESDLEQMVRLVQTLGVTFFDGTTRLEDAAERIGAIARERGVPGALFIDSLQAIAVGEDRTQAVGEVVARVRAAASRHRLVVWATSEMNRSSYRNPAEAAQLNGMAAGADSRAIEFQARVLLNLLSVSGEGDLAELRIVKNKLGPRHSDGPGIVLRLNRSVQTFTAVEGFVPHAGAEAAKEAMKDREQVADAAALAQLLAETPGKPAKDVEAALAARRHCGNGRFRVARSVLGKALVERPGWRTAKNLYLDGAQIPDEVLAVVPLERRPAVKAALPPAADEANRDELSRTSAPQFASRETRTPPLVEGGCVSSLPTQAIYVEGA